MLLMNSMKEKDWFFTQAKLSVPLQYAGIAHQEGLGLDVVSGGELYTAKNAGFPMEKVYFHGNNKSPKELSEALDSGIGRIVVDSVHELTVLNSLCQEKGVNARISVRVKPGIEAHTHDYILTGQIDSKFGVAGEWSFACPDKMFCEY